MIRNVKMDRKGNILTVVIDLSKSGEQSKSGKTNVVATTGGNIEVPGDGGFKIGVNLYNKP